MSENEDEDFENNRSVLKKVRISSIIHDTFKCPICPLHDGENRRKRPRSDKYKNKNRKKLRDVLSKEKEANDD